MENNYQSFRRSSRSQFIKSLQMNENNRISKLSLKQDNGISDKNYANMNRGDKFMNDQKAVNLQRFQEELMKKAKKQMTEEELSHLNFEPNFFIHGKSLRFAEKSFFIFGTQNKFRKSLVWLMEWKFFDRFITFTILLNTIILILQNYKFRLDKDHEILWQRELINYSEIMFTLIFIFEFLVKSLGMGLVLEKCTYLRDGWNIIDFIVVITSIISFSPGMFNLSVSAIRTTRILRPLRSINYIEGIRILIGSMLESLPDLGNVLIFLTFIITLFGILGLQLFMDAFENRCRLTELPIDGIWEVDQSILHLCNESDPSSCPANRYCRNPANYPQYQDLAYDDTDLDYEEFNYGYTKFNDIRFAIFTLFQALTTEGWTKVTFMLTDSYHKALVYLYFVFLILLGSFFVVNLILAVINESFINQHKKNQKKVHQRKKLAKLEENIKKQNIHQNQKNQKQVADSILDYIKDEKLAEARTSQFHKEKSAQQQKSQGQLQNEDNKGSDSEENEENTQMEKQQKNKQSQLNYIREKIKVFVNESSAFLGFTTFCILVNTIILALDKYPQDQTTRYQLEQLNIIFTLVFALEMLIKVFGLGIKGYLQDRFNIFDGVIVVLSVVDLFFQQTNYTNISSQGGFAAISAFRSLRLFRIFKLARSWVNLRHLLLAIGKTLSQIIYFLILVLLFIVVSSLLGMEFFAYKVRFNESGSPALTPEEKILGIPPRNNFDTFLNGIITIFILLTNEDWNTILYEHIRGMNSWYPSMFFISVVVIGNFMLLKLFLAILIYNFGKANSETKEQEIQLQQRKKINRSAKIPFHRKIIMKIKKFFSKKKIHFSEMMKRSKAESKNKRQEQIERLQSTGINHSLNNKLNLSNMSKDQSILNNSNHQMNSPNQNSYIMNIKNESRIESSKLSVTNGNQTQQQQINQISKFFSEGMSGQSFKMRKRGTTRFIPDQLNEVIQGRSLYIFSPTNKIRVEIHKLVKMQQFEACIIALIIFSSIILVIDGPMEDPGEEYKITLNYIDILVTILFALECTLKIIAFGFVANGKHSYMRTFWNILDFLVVIFSISGFFVNDSLKFEKLKIFRILRIFRPLRLISRNKGLKVAINSLINSIPSILNLLVVCLIFFLLFGIFGTNYFKGAFFYCDMSNVNKVYHESIKNKIDCFNYGGDWINSDFNFDNILNSSINLFVLSTTEGWVSMMHTGIDSVGIDQQPRYENNEAWVTFYIFFIIVGSFFIMNLFAGIVVDSFNQEKSKIGGISLLTSEQKDWIEVQLRIFNTEPQNKIEVAPSANFIKKIVFYIVTHKYFEFLILILIICNTLVFMAVWSRQNQDITEKIRYINVGFLIVFALEVLLKLISFGFEYFKDAWNQFDMSIVFLSFIGLLLEYTEVYSNIGTTTSIVRCFRIARVLRLIKKQKSIQMIFNTFISTIPALANIGALLFLVLFLFSVLGMNLFPFVKINHSTQGINEKANFQTFYDSFFLLLKCSTGESWNLVLADIVRTVQPNFFCYDISTYEQYKQYGINGCGTSVGYAFLIIFQLLFGMVVLSLFVAVILEGFEKTMKDEHSVVKPYNLQQFINNWQLYDKKGLGLLKVEYMIPFLDNLEQPLGWKLSKMTQSRKKIMLAQMDIPIYKLRNLQSPYLFYYDVLIELSRSAIQSTLPLGVEIEPEQTVQMQKDLNIITKTKLNQYRNLKVTEYTTADYIAVQIMVERYRQYMQKKMSKKNKKSQKLGIDQNQYPILEEPENEEKSPVIRKQLNNADSQKLDSFSQQCDHNNNTQNNNNDNNSMDSISCYSSSVMSSSFRKQPNPNSKLSIHSRHNQKNSLVNCRININVPSKQGRMDQIKRISVQDQGILPDTQREQSTKDIQNLRL